MTGEKVIEELDKLLVNYIGESKTIIDTKISRLTAPGDNYGSILFKLDITLKNKHDDSQEEFYAVAKLIPDDQMFRDIFNVQVSCKVEIGFYDTIVPTLQQFQKEKGVQQVIDFFPKIYGSRINLNGSDTVDENATLLLENLIEAGYKNVNRFESFDLPTIKLVLKDLAAFHAIPLAIKFLEPETFETKIQPFLKDHGPPPPPPDGNAHFADSMDMVIDILENDEECRPIASQLREKKRGMPKPLRNEPYVTLGHGDLWINNIMVKFQSGKPVGTKFVDFQNPRYTSPVMDLFFLLWTSVRIDVLEDHLDDLLQFYHENFIKNLQQLKCDTSPFTLEKLLEEIKLVTSTELVHVMFFVTFVVLAKKNNSEENKLPHEMAPEDITEIAKERIIYMAKVYQKKGWI